MKKIWVISACLLSVLYVLALTACGNREAEKLDAVDRLSDVDNDSAISILKTIDTLRLNRGQKAFYHLLNLRLHYLSGGNQALSDTIPAWAEEEIKKEGNPDYLFEIHFWKISSYQLQQDAISAMLEAEASRLLLPETSQNETDKIILEAHIDKFEGEIWSIAGDGGAAISLMQKADRGYAKSENHDYIVSNQHNKINLAETLYDKGLYEESLEMLDSIKPVNDDMRRKAEFHRLSPLIKLERYEDVRKITRELLEEGVDSFPLLTAMAEVALHDENVTLAKKYLAQFLQPGIYNLAAFYLQRKIAEKEGNFAEALELQKRISMLENQHNFYVSASEIRQALDRQRKLQLEESRLKAESSRNTTIFVIVLSALAIAAIVAIAILLIRKRKARMDNLVAEIEGLHRKDDEREAKIGGLLAQRFESMNRLCDEYFNLSDIKDENLAKNEIYKTLSAQLKEMGSEGFRKRLEESLNENMDGLMARFRAAFPGDGEAAVLFLYFSSGFSAKAVGIFTKLKKSSVYTRRRRLRERIEQSDTPYREEFLSMLN